MAVIQHRRNFIKSTLAGACLLSSPAVFSTPTLAAAKKRTAGEIVKLGKTGIQSSFLAQGTGFNGGGHASDHTRLGQEAFTQLIRRSMDNGVNFWDTADLYGSHQFVRNALQGIPRNKYVLLTKLWPRREDWLTPSGGATEEVNRFRKEYGVDMLDICLIHCMMNAQWPTEYERIREELSALKEKGAVRAVGVSCHDFGALKVAAENPWVDVILARINHMGGGRYFMDGTAEEISAVLRKARANGKAVIGMKIFGAGRLVKPEEKDASLKYVIGNDLVDAMTVGMLSREQIDDTVKRIETAV